MMFASGCTSTRGRAFVAGDAGLPALGKVVVMPARYVAPEDENAARRAEELACAARQALAGAGVSAFVEAPASGDGVGRRIVSDCEAVMSARAAGADTVCLLTVGDYGESFWITLFLPTFGGNSRVLYSLRLLDVASGKLILEAVRSRSTGGTFAIRGEGSAARDLRNDLALVLAGKANNGARAH